MDNIPTPVRTFIYALAEPGGGVRYIGKTSQTLVKRLRSHINEARCGLQTHKCKWIRSLLTDGLSPTIVLIEECEGDGCIQEIAHIAKARDKGLRLTNATSGGEHFHHGPETIEKIRAAKQARDAALTPEDRRRMAEIARRTFTGRKHSEEHIRLRTQGYRGRKMSEEAKSKMRIAKIGWRPTEALRQAISRAHKGKPKSLETRLKMSEAGKGRPCPNEVRQKLRKANLGKPMSLAARKALEVRWCSEELQQAIVADYQAGIVVAEIMRKCDVTNGTVYRILKRRGVKTSRWFSNSHRSPGRR